MRAALFGSLALVAMTACESSPPVDAALAQCTIDSHGATGRAFLTENKVPADPDAAYLNWMLLCMRAKGFQYDPKQCPPESTPPAVVPNDARCFHR